MHAGPEVAGWSRFAGLAALRGRLRDPVTVILKAAANIPNLSPNRHRRFNGTLLTSVYVFFAVAGFQRPLPATTPRRMITLCSARGESLAGSDARGYPLLQP
jgi:hypothetical protein